MQVGRECEVCAANHRIQVHHCQYRNLIDCTVDDLLVLCDACHEFYHDFVRRHRIDMQQPPQQAKKWISEGRRISEHDRQRRKQTRREVNLLKIRRHKHGKDSKKDRRRIREFERTVDKLKHW